MDVKGNSGEGSERKESWSVNLNLREWLSNDEQNVGSNIDGKGHSVEISDRNKEHVIGHWRKGHSCYKVAKNLAELCVF